MTDTQNCINCGHREESHVQNNGENTCQICDCRDLKLTPDTRRQAVHSEHHDKHLPCRDCEATVLRIDYLESLAVREREEREKAERKAELMKKAAGRYLPCPDHRDKVNTAETGCPYCRVEVAESHEASEWEKNKEMEERVRELRERVAQLGVAEVWNIVHLIWQLDDFCVGQFKKLLPYYVDGARNIREMGKEDQEEFVESLGYNIGRDLQNYIDQLRSPHPPEKEEQG